MLEFEILALRKILDMGRGREVHWTPTQQERAMARIRQSPDTPDPAPLTRSQTLAAARRHYHGDESQAEIAAELGITPSHFSRLMRQAREAGWIRTVIAPDTDPQLARRLRERFPGLRHVEVLDISPRASTQSYAHAMGTLFANFVQGLFQQGPGASRVEAIAVGGGGAQHRMVDLLERPAHPVDVGPAHLASAGGIVTQLGASAVATLLAERFGAFDDEPKARLFDLPLLTQELGRAELLEQTRELKQTPAYAAMREFWQRVDVVLKSVMPMDEMTLGQTKLHADGVFRDLKAAGAIGGIGGQYFDSRGRVVPVSRTDGVVGARLGVPGEVLRSLISRADRSGWVVVELGRVEVADATAHLIDAGVINGLLCTDEAARGMLRVQNLCAP